MSARRDAGLTLLEVVVALAIASLAMVVLFRAGSDGLFAADTAARAEEALERAQSHLAAVGASVAVLPGDSEGDDGDGFHWHLHLEPTEQVPAASGSGAVTTTLYTVEVAVSWPGRGRGRAVTLKTIRLGRSTASR